MTNRKTAREAHEALDKLIAGALTSEDEQKLLRGLLPERTREATLEEVQSRVKMAIFQAEGYSSWAKANNSSLANSLTDIYNDLTPLIDKEKARDLKLPAGMRLANHETYGRVVTSPKSDKDGLYLLLISRRELEVEAEWTYAHECELKFIDFEPTQPTFLETTEDYKYAPLGTIVAQDDLFTAWVKTAEGWSSTDVGLPEDCPSTSCTRRVLRWGMGSD